MKYVFVALLLLATFISCEEIESYTFASLSWGSTRDEVKKCLIEKGYTFDQEFTKAFDVNEVIFFKGEVTGEEALISVRFNSNNELVKCIIVLYPGENEAIETYQSIKDILISKYGEFEDTYKIFKHPYEEGDGYETQGIKLGKVHFHTFWAVAKDSSKLHIGINESLDIAIHYESSKWSIEREKIKAKQAEDL